MQDEIIANGQVWAKELMRALEKLMKVSVDIGEKVGCWEEDAVKYETILPHEAEALEEMCDSLYEIFVWLAQQAGHILAAAVQLRNALSEVLPEDKVRKLGIPEDWECYLDEQFFGSIEPPEWFKKFIEELENRNDDNEQ